MELAVGMYYISNNRLIIGRVVKVIDNNRFDIKVLRKEQSIIPASLELGKVYDNKIDLIEVGDYVNGYLVIGSDYQTVNDELKKIIYTNEQEYYFGWSNMRFDCEHRNKIKSIVTKEQFEANAYTIEKDE